ncbi:hypothetical protein JOF56_003754 [Kibdelosporangium banguiense]|uniref:PKD domain-containing protein n=1 Tax=Kibdelosporangium banguiense TaxID=1365924 RepID=A0ABS4TG21_9PSEU|nr:hypothetical protein [Kibdelosporangium banguiense]MBP2323369.1 hypothetical protein [Kibdelosporangium banguiense]
MPIDTAKQRENLALAYGNAATHVAAHSTDPGNTGTGEISGTRKSVIWTPGTVDGVITATVTLDIPSGATVGGIGLWDAASGGNYLDGGTVTAQAYSANGTYTITLTYTQN